LPDCLAWMKCACSDRRGQHNLGVVYGIDYDRFAGLSHGFSFLSGGPFGQPGEAIADDLAASPASSVGMSTTLNNHDFKISGIVMHGKGARFFIPLKTAQEIAGADKRVSMFYVRSTGTRKQFAMNDQAAPNYRFGQCGIQLVDDVLESSRAETVYPFVYRARRCH